MNTDRTKFIGVRIICLSLIGISGFLFFRAASFPAPRGVFGTDYGSAFFPRLMLGVIVVCAVLLLVRSVVARTPAGSSEGLALDRNQVVRVALVWFVCFLLYVGWRNFEFLYTAIPFMVALAYVVGVRRPLSLALMALVAPIVYAVFELGLRVGL